MREDRLVSHVLGEDAVLAPADLYGKQFRRSLFGGYNAQEVDAYLERVAGVLESLNQEIKALKEQGEQQKTELDDHRQMELTLRNALVTSQKFGEDLIESARREADTLVESAKVEKELLMRQALRLPEALATEIQGLQEQRDRLRGELESLLSSHQALLARQPAAETALGLVTENTSRVARRVMFEKDSAETERPDAPNGQSPGETT